MGSHFILSLFLVVFTVGCAALSGAPSTVKAACSYDQAWAVSLASVDEFALHKVDKAKGVIATEWMGFASRRTAGLFSRDANQERARFFLNLEPDQQAMTIAVHQIREHFSPMGVQSQSTGWRRIAPIAEEERRLVQRISKQLREKGCSVLS